MNGYTVALLISAVFAGIACAYYRVLIYDPQMRQVQKYGIFASRDEFVRLKIQGCFDHDPELYAWYCHFCNSVIANSKEFNFLSLLSVILVNIEPSPQFEDLRKRIAACPLPVREAHGRLSSTIMQLVEDNSTFLRVVLRIYRKPSEAWAKIPKVFKKMEFTKPVEAYNELEHFGCPA